MGRTRKEPAAVDQDFLSRLVKARGDMSLRAFADLAGLSHSALDSYEKGKSEPVRSILFRIAEVAGMSVEWLMTGGGSIHPSSSEIIDRSLLLNLMKGYAQLAKSQGMSIEPDQMAEWTTLRYGIIVNSGSPPQAYAGMIEMALAELALTLKERQ